MNTNPQRSVSSPCLRAEAAGPSPSFGSAAAIPYSLARFLDTLGMADDTPWKPSHEADECPF